MLTPTQMAAREGKLTASAVGALMTGDETKIMNLWRSMIGDPAYEPEDLSDVWPVQLGSETERLNLNWYEFKTGHKVTRRGEVVVHPMFDWAAATLDGWIPAIGAPIECKHVGGHEPREVVRARYMPQMHWQMMVLNTRTCVYSVIEGASEPRVDTIRHDDDYADTLWKRALDFMDCVHSMTPPIATAPVTAPVRAVVTYDMATSNQWANEAGVWLATFDAGKKAEKAAKELKGMVPSDAERVHGHGVEITRDRAGRLSLREKKEQQ